MALIVGEAPLKKRFSLDPKRYKGLAEFTWTRASAYKAIQYS